MYETGKINAQSQYGIAYLSFLNKSWSFEAEIVFETVFRVLEPVFANTLGLMKTKADTNIEAWCPEEDSNLHTLRHTDLNRARLPIPPSGLKARIIYQ